MISKAFNKIELQRKSVARFFKMESAGGIVLIFAAALALIMSNTPLSRFYDHLLHMPVSIMFGDVGLAKPLLLWINDGLMAVFFFLVGLEIKREMLCGHLSSKDKALLPLIAAVGGMALPALVYYLVNHNHPENLHGWAIPSATDIAFALGILSLLGSRVPVSLKILLTAIAVIDDLGAVIIIALFYTGSLSTTALAFAAFFIAALFLLNRRGVNSRGAYLLVGLCLWLAVLKSGVHATLAGVVTALFIPHRAPDDNAADYDAPSMLARMEHALHPWVAFFIMPVFAFANAGVPLKGLTLDALLQPLPLGIAAGLFIGKQLGIFLSVYAAVKSGLCSMPQQTGWRHIHALSLLCGIGFTMSLFIGTLAFQDPSFAAPVRLGVLGGSTLSAVAGYLLMRKASPRQASL